MEDREFDPLSDYLRDLKDAHTARIVEKYEELEKKSGISLSENIATVKEYNAAEARVQKAEKAADLNKSCLALAILIFAGIALYGGYLGEQSRYYYALVPVGIFGLFLSVILLNKKIRNLDKRCCELVQTAEELKKKALRQTSPLCGLFSDRDAKKLTEATMPCLSFDESFFEQRLSLMRDYGYEPEDYEDESVTELLSGELYNRPFAYVRRLFKSTDMQTYHGFSIISWTTSYVNAEGEPQTKHHMQTLHASITRPKPVYDSKTELVYCNEVLPELTFSRTYAHVELESKRSLSRKLARGEKELLKMTDDSLKHGGDFIATFNTDFEILFNATDRSDELAFRRAFTAEAQENTVRLLLSKEGYGDDFEFEKRGKVHYIRSEHSQARPLQIFAKDYFSHDAAECKKLFLSLNKEFFKGTFFDFAPLLLLPSYRNPSAKNVVFYSGTRTKQAREALANRSAELFSETDNAPSILKTKLLKAEENGEELVRVTASFYKEEDRVEYVSVFGGDGDFHDVPVEWTEYVPMIKETIVRILPNGELVLSK